MGIRPNQWTVVGNTKRTLNIGEVRNATDGGWWVYWYTDMRAEVVTNFCLHKIHDTRQQAIADFEDRAASLWGRAWPNNNKQGD